MRMDSAIDASKAGIGAAVGRRPRAERLALRGKLRPWLISAPAFAVFGGLFIAPVTFFFALSFWSKRAMRLVPDFTFENYVETWEKYAGVIVITLGIALATAVLTTTIAFAFAYLIRFKVGRLGPPLLFITLLTLFGGYLVKIYAWKAILGKVGILNSALLALGIIDEPLTIFIYNPAAVIVTLTYFLLPLAVLPIYGSLRAIDDETIEAARDVGARPRHAFRDIVFPLARSGTMAAFTLSFLVAAGDYVTPRFVGGPYTAMIGDFIEQQFSLRFDWPMGSAMSFSVLGACIPVVLAAAAVLSWSGRR
jgi:spermidine/putrescine transport system permease protein